MKSRRIALFGFFCLFIIETLVNRGVKMTPFQWVMLAFAASMVGRASAYLSVLEWLRAPFAVTVQHSSSAGTDYHPRWTTGVRSAVAELICCPVCAGTWGATIILTLFKFFPSWGETIMITLSTAALAWLITFVTQFVEWKTHEAREHTGLMNVFQRGQKERAASKNVIQRQS
jgi:hypothetical protein